MENKNRAETLQANGEKVYTTEEVLGDMKPVKEIAAFYKNHKTNLDIVKTYLLFNYCDKVSFTKEQYDAYRMGLDAMVTFFENTGYDVESYLMEAQEKNRKSVG